MIMDQAEIYSDAQAVSATAYSTRLIDNHSNGDDVVRAKTLFVHVGTGWTGGGTVAVELHDCDTESGSYTKVAELVPASAVTAVDGNGFLFVGPVPKGCRRYRKLRYVIANTVTGLKVTAGENLGAAEPLPSDILTR